MRLPGALLTAFLMLELKQSLHIIHSQKKGSSKFRIKLISSSKNMVPYFSHYFEISIP